MTKKHFETVARAIATITDGADALNVQQTFVAIGKDLNPRFDEDRFKDRVRALRDEYYCEEILPIEASAKFVEIKKDGVSLSGYLADYLVEESIVPDRMGETVHDALDKGIDAFQGGAE